MFQKMICDMPCNISKYVHQCGGGSFLQGTNSFLMFHAEVTDGCCGTAKSEAILDKSAYSTFLESRPKSMENAAIKLVIQLCKEYRVPCHIVHLASAEALPLIKQAKQDGIDLTVETCFHYLFFDAETIPSGILLIMRVSFLNMT